MFIKVEKKGRYEESEFWNNQILKVSYFQVEVNNILKKWIYFSVNFNENIKKAWMF